MKEDMYEIVYNDIIPENIGGYTVVYHNDFEIISVTGGLYIKGKEKYKRLLIKPLFKIEELTGEVIDEETKTIHRCHPFYVSMMTEEIMRRKIDAMKQKNHIFNKEQINNLRYICNCLYYQNMSDDAEEIENQYLEKSSFIPMSYDDMINKYLPMIKDTTKEHINSLWKPIYKMRNEPFPTIM